MQLDRIWTQVRPSLDVLHQLRQQAKLVRSKRAATEKKEDPRIRIWCEPSEKEAEVILKDIAAVLLQSAKGGFSQAEAFRLPTAAFGRHEGAAVPAALAFEDEEKQKCATCTHLYLIAPLLLKEIISLHDGRAGRPDDFPLTFTTGGYTGPTGNDPIGQVTEIIAVVTIPSNG